MKNHLAILVIFFSALMTSHIANAGFNFDHERDNNRGYGQKFRNAPQDEDNVYEQRREREERGVRRLQQHRWQTGYVMPQHYRGNSYKVDYKNSNLPRPSRNQQWYKINNDYILVDSDSNSIINIKSM